MAFAVGQDGAEAHAGEALNIKQTSAVLKLLVLLKFEPEKTEVESLCNTMLVPFKDTTVEIMALRLIHLWFIMTHSAFV